MSIDFSFCDTHILMAPALSLTDADASLVITRSVFLGSMSKIIWEEDVRAHTFKLWEQSDI